MLWRLRFLLLLVTMSAFFSSFSSATGRDDNTLPSADSLDSIIRDHAFQAAMHRRVDVVYRVPPPAKLPGIEVAVMRLSGKSLWLNGANINSFKIPPKTFTVPPVRRLAIVYQNLGNWSSCYYNVHNYSATMPVVGLLAYDAFDLNSNGKVPIDFSVPSNEPISVAFPYVTLTKGLDSSLVKCVRFDLNGSAILHDAQGWKGCSTMKTGHFMMVFPSTEVPTPASSPLPLMTDKANDKRKLWVVWAIACGCGVVGCVLLVMLRVSISRLAKRKRMQEMERQSEEGVVLDNVWVGGSKMPSASMVRTRPVLENGSAP